MPWIQSFLSWVSRWLMHCYDHTVTICGRLHNCAIIWPIEDVILKVWHISLAVALRAISRVSCHLVCRQLSIAMHGVPHHSSSLLPAWAVYHKPNSIALSTWG